MISLAVVLFLLGAGFAVYVVAGYPMLLVVLAHWKPRPLRRSFTDATVTVMLAVYNGEKWIRAKLESILRLNYPHSRMHILVISDGSTDRTDPIVREFESEGVELMRVPHGGKAAALNAGMRHANGEILFFTDVRQELDPDALRNLVECLGDAEVGGASGQIVFTQTNGGREADVGLYWRFEKWLRDQLTASGSLLVATGCVYVLRRNLARPLPTDALVDDAFLPLAAVFSGYRFVFERRAIAYDYPTELNVEFARKVRTLAGLFQVVDAYPKLLNVFTPVGFHFFSYKLGRLLLPYAFLSMAISSFWLPQPWSAMAVTAQASFYALALINDLLPDRCVLKRVSSVCRTFVVLIAAAFCAGSVLFVPAGGLWKETKVKPPAGAKLEED